MLGVIVNPNALGVARDRGLAERLRHLLGAEGEVVETSTSEEVASAIDRLGGCSLMASCGGDGTNLAILTELVRRPAPLPPFALLRGGTANTVAANLGIAGRPEQILARLLSRRRRGEPVPEVEQDLLEVNGRFGFLCAAAMGARFLEAYYRTPRPGIGWASLLAVRTAVSSLVQGQFAQQLFAPVPLRLSVDRQRETIRAARLVVASVVPSVGIGMRVAYRAGTEPQRFHLVASGISTTAMALQLRRVRRGQSLSGSPHVDRLATEATAEFDRPESYTLDGELFRDTALRMRIGPRIQIVLP